MRELHDLTADDLQGLSPQVVAALATKMLVRLREQDRHIERREERIERLTRDNQFKQQRIEKLTFETAARSPAPGRTSPRARGHPLPDAGLWPPDAARG